MESVLTMGSTGVNKSHITCDFQQAGSDITCIEVNLNKENA